MGKTRKKNICRQKYIIYSKKYIRPARPPPPPPRDGDGS